MTVCLMLTQVDAAQPVLELLGLAIVLATVALAVLVEVAGLVLEPPE